MNSELARDVYDGLIYDIVMQSNKRKACFLCSSTHAFLHTAEVDGDESDLYLCEICKHKLTLFKENIQEIIKED